MIHTAVLQETFKRAEELRGMEVHADGGNVRFLAYLMQKEGYDLTVQDVLDSLEYMIRRGWLVEAGSFGRFTTYNVVPENPSGSGKNPIDRL